MHVPHASTKLYGDSPSRIVTSMIHNILAEAPKSERIARLIYNEVGGDHEKAIQFLRSLQLAGPKENAIQNALCDIKLGLKTGLLQDW